MAFTLRVFFSWLFSFFQPDDPGENIPSVVYRLIRYFGIRITCSTTGEYIKPDPDYPTLKSICNFFEDNSITYYPLKLDIDDLYDLKRPFLAHIHERGGKVLLVYSINEKKVIYTDSRHGIKAMSISDFLEKWKGVVIVIEPDTLIGEPDYLIKRCNEIIRRTIVPFIFLISMIAVISSVSSTNLLFGGFINPVNIMIFFAHIVGLFFSILLFRHELDIKTTFTEKLCHISTNTDCNAVTKSNVSRIFGNISWADAGIIYFSGGLILGFILPVKSAISLFTLLSIFSLPYPLFSIFYQWLKIKKWCPMCLSVQTILLLEFVVLIPALRTLDFSIPVLITALMVYSVVLLVIIMMKLLIINEKEKDQYKINLLKLKRNPDLFIQQLESGEKNDFPKEAAAFVFGDMTSEVVVTIFLSTYCSACSVKFREILILIRNKIKVKVQLIYSSIKDELSTNLLKIILLKVLSNERNEALELLEKWYKADKVLKNTVLQGIRIPESTGEFDEMIRYNQNIFQIGEVKMVPSVFINGFPLPSIYSLEDIRFHINVLGKIKKEQI